MLSIIINKGLKDIENPNYIIKGNLGKMKKILPDIGPFAHEKGDL